MSSITYRNPFQVIGSVTRCIGFGVEQKLSVDFPPWTPENVVEKLRSVEIRRFLYYLWMNSSYWAKHSVYPFFILSVRLFFSCLADCILSVCLAICLYVFCLPVRLFSRSVHLFVCLSDCLSVCFLSTCLYVCVMFICIPIHLLARLPVCFLVEKT